MLAHLFMYVYTSISIVLSISVCIYVIINIFCKATKLLFSYISFPVPFYCFMVVFKSKSLIIFRDLEAAKCNRNRCICSNLY